MPSTRFSHRHELGWLIITGVCCLQNRGFHWMDWSLGSCRGLMIYSRLPREMGSSASSQSASECQRQKGPRISWGSITIQGIMSVLIYLKEASYLDSVPSAK